MWTVGIACGCDIETGSVETEPAVAVRRAARLSYNGAHTGTVAAARHVSQTAVGRGVCMDVKVFGYFLAVNMDHLRGKRKVFS